MPREMADHGIDLADAGDTAATWHKGLAGAVGLFAGVVLFVLVLLVAHGTTFAQNLADNLSSRKFTYASRLSSESSPRSRHPRSTAPAAPPRAACRGSS